MNKENNKINETNLDENTTNELNKIIQLINIESEYLDMIYNKGFFITDDTNWLRNSAFCDDNNKKTADVLFDFSNQINDIFEAFDHKNNEEYSSKLVNSIVQMVFVFESINISLLTNIYRELYRNAHNIGPKNNEFLNMVRENLKILKESIKEQGISLKEEIGIDEDKLDELEINENLFKKYEDDFIFMFMIKPLLLNFKEGALINLKDFIDNKETDIKELTNLVENNDKFYDFICMNKNQNFSDKMILINASKTFNEFHYLKFDEDLIKGLLALNPKVSEIYNGFITQTIIEESKIEHLLGDAINIKELKKLMSNIFKYERQMAEKYKFPDILISKEYLIIIDPEKGEIVSIDKLNAIAEFLILNGMDFEKTFEELKIVIEFTIKKTIEELSKMEQEMNQEIKKSAEEKTEKDF